MTLEEAKQLLTKSELKSFKEYLKECIKFKKENQIPSKQYDLLKLKTKVTRWDELKTQLQFELDKLTIANQDSIEKLLYDNYEEGYYKTIFDAEQFQGFSSSFNGLDKQAIGKAINTKWLGDNYSSRIWKNENSLMNILNQELPRGLALGTNPRELSKQVSKRLNTNYNNTVRLVRTEYANVLNNSTLAGYKASGIDRYQILAALDERTCDDCDDFNEEIFEVKDAQEGINMPPFHPNCRCTTIPYFEKDEIDEMLDEELDNIGFVTYNDWKDGLVTLTNNTVTYVTNLKERTYNKNNESDVRIIDKIANATYNLANRYIGDKGLWNGDINIVPDTKTAHFNFADKNYSIDMTETTSPYLFLHEQLHGHSAAKFDKSTYINNARIEEGTVELLARAISKKEHIERITDISPIYDECANALHTLNKTLKIAKTDLELGQKLIKIDLDKRYDYLESMLETYKQTTGLTQIDKIQKLQIELDKLYGSIKV